MAASFTFLFFAMMFGPHAGPADGQLASPPKHLASLAAFTSDDPHRLPDHDWVITEELKAWESEEDSDGSSPLVAVLLPIGWNARSDGASRAALDLSAAPLTVMQRSPLLRC